MIYLTKPYFGEEELKRVSETFESGWVAGQGPMGRELSELASEYIGCKYSIPVNNCTAGLHLALLAIGTGQGDEVLVSDFTFPATGHAVLYCGAKPVFVDADADTYNMDPSDLEKKITSASKAIIVVHGFGLMADMDKIMDIAKRNNLKVIEDAACAFGASYKGKKAGRYGDITCFSFHARKNVTAGEGGLVVTDNEKYASYIRSLTFFGTESAYDRQSDFSIPSFVHLGFNYKLSDINAAIAIEQIKRYHLLLEKKYELVKKYREYLEGYDNIFVQPELEDYQHVYQTFVVRLDEKINRNKIILSLREDGIQTQIGTYSSFIQPVYKSEDNCPVSLRLYNSALALPLYYEMKTDDVKTVCEKLKFHIEKQLTGE